MRRISSDPVPLFVNGRFLAQKQSGVQRFATETALALGRRAAARGEPQPVLLLPRGADVALDGLQSRQVGHLHGQAWEQLELSFHARRGVLLNLGNTAPLVGGDQVVVIHDAGVFRHPETYSKLFCIWYKWMQARLVRGRTRIATVSHFAQSEIIRWLGAEEAEIDVVCEGAEHMARLSADDSILARHGLVAGNFVVAVSNLAAHKNLAALGATAASLAARGMELVIVGGLDTKVFASRKEAMPHPARYIGRVSDEELRALYQAANCFVFPSLYEGFGLPAVEAMACRCLVVAADIPALREVCDDAALYCDPADPADIAAKLCLLVDDPALRLSLRAPMEARLRHYNWDRAAELLNRSIDRAVRMPVTHQTLGAVS